MADILQAAKNANKALKSISRKELATHNTPESSWIAVDSLVFDVTNFIALHPGGELVLREVAGKDATEEFYAFHRHAVLSKMGPKLLIGVLEGETPKVVQTELGSISQVPFAESPFWQGYKSPYYTEAHKAYRLVVRKFFEEHVYEEALAHEDNGKPPSKELWRKMGDLGIHAVRLGPGKHLKDFNLPGGIKPEEFTYFHEQITHEEIARFGTRGYSDGLGGGMVIGLPPVLNFGTEAVKQRVVGPVLRGEKFICLAVSEPDAGSDVAGMRTRAVKTPDGKFYIVNGMKKWITNGTFSDYFTTAVRTEKGYSMLLIERGEGVETKAIKTAYSPTAGTALVIFENVKVPVENILGKEDRGFEVIMSNFNHERWAMCVASNRTQRTVIEECIKWANQRKVFGNKLISQPVIRAKLAKMIANVEANTQWLDFITHQMNNMNYKEQADKLAGPIALLKYQITRSATLIADESVQIFGGRGITKTGMGRVIEGFMRTYKFDSILGGSEEILADLAVRQALRKMPNAKL